MRFITDLFLYAALVMGIIKEARETSGVTADEKFHYVHIIFLVIVFMWEMTIYIVCVRRASYKLTKERSESQTSVDNFIKSM